MKDSMRMSTKSSDVGLSRDETKPSVLIISAIRNRDVLSFSYHGRKRLVEPQTFGVSTTGRPVLRARQIGGSSDSGQSRIAKLFDLEKISALTKTGAQFREALPEHNPHDLAMSEVIATLPRAKKAHRV